MKILHTSDWHLGRTLYDFSLLEDQEKMLCDIQYILEQQSIDVLVIAGDIYDRAVPSAAAIQLYDAFLSQVVGKMGIPVMAIAGNHDSSARLQFGSSLYASSGYYVVGQPQTTIEPIVLQDSYGSVFFWLIPYLQPAYMRVLFGDAAVHTFDDAYRVLLQNNQSLIDPSVRNIAVAHGNFSAIGQAVDQTLVTSDSEISIGGMDLVDSAHFAPFDYTALGHLHAPQRAGHSLIRYSGSPLKYSLSEETQKKSVAIVSLHEKGDVSTEVYPLAAMRNVRTIRGRLDQLLEPSFDSTGAFDDYVFAELSEKSVLYPMEKLRTLYPHVLGLRLLQQEEQSPEIYMGANTPKLLPQDMFARFYEQANGTEIPEEHYTFLCEALTQYLEKEDSE